MKDMGTANAIFSIVFCTCLILGISACSSPSPNSNPSASKAGTQEVVSQSGNQGFSVSDEQQILADVQAKDSYYSTYSLNIDSFSITKRQTNADDKNDFVWCAVAASNSVFSYSAEYKVTYVLYNDGWLLEECNQSNSSVIPNSPPTQTQAEAEQFFLEYEEQHLLDHVVEIQVKRRSTLQKLSDVSYAYYFRIVGKTIYGDDTIPGDYAVYYHFDPISGWSSEVASVDLNWG